ncbi:hypothetical protein GTO10_01590 [Candidatus Saccharibacteria bacterium]|nr:hypothetical protein [Candidatus Saccharibacteria bacterium]
MLVSLVELQDFLADAALHTYAVGGERVAPWNLGFKEIEYIRGTLRYRDSWAGSRRAPGREVIFLLLQTPIWSRWYDGGIRPRFWGDGRLVKEAADFLKESLRYLPVERPWRRGPAFFRKGRWVYTSVVVGSMRSFVGIEWILQLPKGVVFQQIYGGGLVVGKEVPQIVE